MKPKHTPGTWTRAKNGGGVVSDTVPDNYTKDTGHNDFEYYGGFLIAESVLEDNIPILCAAPAMLEALKAVEAHYLGKHTIIGNHEKALLKKVQQAISKAITLSL